MQSLKPIFGIIQAVYPVVYCGYLIYYFLHVSGSVQDAETNGLGPTILGLGVVGLLFCIPLILRIAWIFMAFRTPRSGGRGDPDGTPPNGEGAFDADAVVARYMAERAKESALNSPAAPSAPEGGGPAKRPGFGRRVR